MAVRLIKMRTVLKETGSIYLHCDPYASHYLKLVMDIIFGRDNFRNEIVWCYGKSARGAKAIAKQFARNNDILLFYSKEHKKHCWNKPYENKTHSIEELPSHIKYDDANDRYFKTAPRGDYTDESIEKFRAEDRIYETQRGNIRIKYFLELDPTEKHVLEPVLCGSVWNIPDMMHTSKKERLGYPTQKPLALLERVIRASSNEGSVVLDPFCGCGTTIEAAEKLNRQWIGIDISAFATGLIRERVVRNTDALTKSMIAMYGVPIDIEMAEGLANKDKFEFEKWVCGAIGAYGMYHSPGTRGADGGVDGVLEFYPFRFGKKPEKEYAIIQVKGGRVSPDSVRALYQTVKDTGATAGVMVCFEKYMQTVENNRRKETFSDDSDGSPYPVIQGFSIEKLLSDERLDLPQYRKRAEANSPKIRLI